MSHCNEIAKKVLSDIHNKSYEVRLSIVERALLEAEKRGEMKWKQS